MNDEMQPEIEKLARSLLLSPLKASTAIDFLQCGILGATRSNVVFEFPTRILTNLEPNMNSNRAFRQPPQDGFQRLLYSISGFVVVILRMDAAQFVGRNNFPARRDDEIVQDVTNAKLLT